MRRKRLEDEKKEEVLRAKAEKLEIKTVGKIDIDAKKAEVKNEPVVEEKTESKEEEKKLLKLMRLEEKGGKKALKKQMKNHRSFRTKRNSSEKTKS